MIKTCILIGMLFFKTKFFYFFHLNEWKISIKKMWLNSGWNSRHHHHHHYKFFFFLTDQNRANNNNSKYNDNNNRTTTKKNCFKHVFIVRTLNANEIQCIHSYTLYIAISIHIQNIFSGYGWMILAFSNVNREDVNVKKLCVDHSHITSTRFSLYIILVTKKNLVSSFFNIYNIHLFII